MGNSTPIVTNRSRSVLSFILGTAFWKVRLSIPKQHQVSASDGIGRTGIIHQYVLDKDAAWHADKTDQPTARFVLEKKGAMPSLYTVGIEHEDNKNLPSPGRKKWIMPVPGSSTNDAPSTGFHLIEPTSSGIMKSIKATGRVALALK